MDTHTSWLTCRSICGFQPVDLRWRPLRRGGFRLGAYCTRCGWFIRWIPQTAEWLADAPPRK